MKTKERLAEALTEAGAPSEIIQRALDGYYDDYESPSAVPIMTLVSDCEKERLFGIANRARNGEFDATREEFEAYMNRARNLK